MSMPTEPLKMAGILGYASYAPLKLWAPEALTSVKFKCRKQKISSETEYTKQKIETAGNHSYTLASNLEEIVGRIIQSRV